MQHNYPMKEKLDKKTPTTRLLVQLVSIFFNITSLYFLHKTKLLPIHLFCFILIVAILITAIFISFSKHHKFSTLFLILYIIINITLSFLLYKYNDYFSKISSNETYFEKYSLVTLKNSDLTKNATSTIAPLGLLTSDPYFETVKQYLISTEGSRPDLLKTSLEETNLKTYDNLLALTTALFSLVTLISTL